MLISVCFKAYYKIYSDSEVLPEKFSTHTCEYIAKNPDVLKLVEPSSKSNDITIFEHVNNFITNVTLSEFSELYLKCDNTIHPNYLREKYNLMKDTPTYFIVTRDKKYLKMFADVVRLYNERCNITCVVGSNKEC